MSSTLTGKADSIGPQSLEQWGDMTGTQGEGMGDVPGLSELRTTERVLTLLGLLQQRQVWTGPELSLRLGVTPRTVRRDVDRLRALGYPVHAAQGVGGGYRLGPGQDLPPLLLDDEEAIATAVALLAGASSADAALRALSKLDQVLPARLRQEVRALSETVESFGGGRPPVDSEVLMTLARACRDQVEAGFSYPARGSDPGASTAPPLPPGSQTAAPVPSSRWGYRPEPQAVGEGGVWPTRRVEPYRLVASDRRWYLFAFDLDRNDWRTFRVDRMTGVRSRTWRFTPRPAPDAAQYVQESIAGRVYPHQARFLVHASAGTVRAQISASAAVVRPIDNDSCEVFSGAASLDVILAHVLLLGHAFEILEPAGLAERAQQLGERLLAAGRPGLPKETGPT